MIPISPRTSWATFLKAHWGVIAAIDFFTVEVLTMHGLVCYSLLFVIDLKTRCVHLAGIDHDPYGAWMEQVARNLTDPRQLQHFRARPVAGALGRNPQLLLPERSVICGRSCSGTPRGSQHSVARAVARRP